jgi:DNA (cytosine-5)-methyltransferase 1
MTFGSLFSGIGGMDLGLERAGMQCRWQVEIDDYARRVLAKHWPGVQRHNDIRTFPPSNTICNTCNQNGGALANFSQRANSESATDVTGWYVDLIAGGFPCQDISFAGKGEGLAGERSGLWYEFARVIRVLGPRYVLVENVAALLHRGIDQVLGTLDSLGYDAEWACIPAAAAGAPHIRDRVFIVAYAKHDWLEIGRGIKDIGQKCNPGRNRRIGTPCMSVKEEKVFCNTNGPRLEIGEIFGGNAHQKLTTFKRANCENGGQWHEDPAESPESCVGRVAYGVSRRVDRIRGLGNAVVPQVAEFIGRQILEYDQRLRHLRPPA